MLMLQYAVYLVIHSQVTENSDCQRLEIACRICLTGKTLKRGVRRTSGVSGRRRSTSRSEIIWYCPSSEFFVYLSSDQFTGS
jgi:hypothetical protein